MPELGLRLVLKFWDNALRQHLAEFHTPLVKRIDVPNDALSEDRVFVKGNELTERFRCQPPGKNRVRRPVTLEDTMRHEPIRRPFGLHFLLCLTERERLGLSEDICQEYVVMPPERIE